VSGRFSIAHLFRGARASRVLANASSRSRTFPDAFLTDEVPHHKRLFRRNAKTNTRDVCASQKERRFARLSPCSRGEDEGEGSERTRFGVTLTPPSPFERARRPRPSFVARKFLQWDE
jgi:hypothetical protein